MIFKPNELSSPLKDAPTKLSAVAGSPVAVSSRTSTKPESTSSPTIGRPPSKFPSASMGAPLIGYTDQHKSSIVQN